ncbi:MAG: response regulator, partial [Acidobacteria bacterium]|nr:response regulator [Acidobacteriota bacterium]
MTDAVKAAVAAQRVLIVEDDESARVGLTELVRTWGFTVESAPDGEAALAMVTAFRPTLVVSDLVMPRMDGLALLSALGDDLAHIYFVLLTAQGTVETAVDALKRGAEDYLTKPVDPQRLRHLLERLSELSAARRENSDLRRRLRE